ncbi:PREDICTED: telomere-associated protein RIF1-like [Branchiostoma belcheri]|uniref:Telomere-associated protein RIF1-like n=1 Tax=Branchiostoma belcheri TaxID=7741 RepID=A0A6P4ZVQ8_BRABE|nr:PREDICTED: telomere-associated protein RIF1-like [Branchiostoma belcheri]
MAVHAHRWSKLVLLSVVHTAPKVRERSAAALEIGVPAMMPQQEAVVAGLIPELKSTLIPELTKLFKPNQEEFVLKVWGSIITLLGKSIHKGGSVINGLLGIVEQGFKSAYIDTRVASYVAWKHLINNFATNPDTISNAKRLKLLLQPLLMNSTKQESVAVVRLDTWWHLAQTLGTNLPPNFEQVCGPLLQFTLGLTPGLPTPATPAGGKMLLATTPQRRGSFPAPNPATPRTPGVGGGHPPSKAIQLIGAEILLHLLGKTGTAAAAKLTLAPLHEELITSPAFFIKHAETFIRATQEAMCAIGSDLQEVVVLNIWSSLTGHIRQALQEGPRKDSQISDMFSQYLACTQEVVASRKLRAGVMLKLLEEVSSLPQKVLSSTSYCHGGSKDVMNGTPALVLLQLLLESPDLIQACSTEERYFTVFQSLVSCGASRPTSFLGFSQSVLQNLDKTAG